MAQLINVKLSRFDAQPWGFRLQGGKDFGAPLLIQKVSGGSLAEKAGLQAGDAVIRVNSTELFNLRHKDAQDAIVRAGNNFEISVQRGGGTWKPAVTPVGNLPSVNSAAAPANIQPVTKTSLAARPQGGAPIASGYNVAAKPFGGAQVNGSLGDGTVKSIVNKQYNTPVGMYSEETIAETLSAQAEVLAGGVLGVNFKKNEKSYNPGNSEVLKLLQEIDNEPRESEPAPPPSSTFFSTSSHAIGGTPRPLTPLAQRLGAGSAPSPGAAPRSETPKCTDCEKPIVGGKAPAGAISAALAGAPGLRQGPAAPPAPRPAPAPAPVPAPALAPATPGSPQTLGPVPFHAPASVAPPKPFSAPSAPTTSPARPAPVSNKFVWPPKTEEGSISPGPTATPLYIPPVPLAQTKEATPTPSLPKTIQKTPSNPNTQQTFKPQATNYQQVPVQPIQTVQSFVPPSVPVPTQAAETQLSKDQVSPFPLPYSDFVSTQKAYQMRSISSPTPTATHKAPFQQPVSNINEGYVNVNENQAAIAPQASYSETIREQTLHQKEESNAQFTKKASVCSQEVSLITESKSISAVERISESLETQTLVSNIIQSQERPSSPIPTKQTEDVSAPQEIPIQNTQATEKAENVPVCDQKSDETSTQETREQILENQQSVSIEQNNNVIDVQQQEQQQQLEKEVSELKSISNIESSETIEQQEQTQTYKETVKALEQTLELSSSQTISVSKETASESASTAFSTEVQEQAKPLPVSSNIVPKEWQSSLLAALTTASERPYSPFPAATAPPTYATQTKPSDASQPLSYKQLPVQPAGGFRPITSEQQVCQEVSQLTSLSQNDPPPSTIPAPVPLPKQMAPYRPLVELSSSNPMSRSEACPSPMLQALTIASERPYSPLPAATRPQTPIMQQTSTVAKPTTAAQPQNVVSPAVPTAPVAPKPLESSEPLLPLLPVSTKHMSMLEALTVAPDQPYSPFTGQPFQSSTTSQLPNTVVQSEASAFTAVSPQSVTTGPKISSPKATPSTNLFKPLPKSNIQRPQTRTPVSSPRPASRASLPVMGGFRPTVLPGTPQGESQDSGYQDYQSSFQSNTIQESQSPQYQTEVVDLGGGKVVTRRTRIEESYSHTHKEMQKTIQRSVGQAPIVSSSQLHQKYEQSSNLQQTFVNQQEVQRTQQQKQHISSFGSAKPEFIPFYQKDIERFREQRAISPAPHSAQMRALSPVPTGQRPITPNVPIQVKKPVTPTSHSHTLPHTKKAGSGFQAKGTSTGVTVQVEQQQKQYSLSTAPKPGVIPFYQKDIERYQMQRAMSPSPLTQQVRSSPLPSQQNLPRRSPQPAPWAKQVPQQVQQQQSQQSKQVQQQQQQVQQSKQVQQQQQQAQQSKQVQQQQQQAQQSKQVQQQQQQAQQSKQVQQQRVQQQQVQQKQQKQQQQLGQNLSQNQTARPISPFFGLPQPSIVPFYQRDIERYQTQRALSPAPHAQSMRALSPTPQAPIPILDLKPGVSHQPYSFSTPTTPGKFVKDSAAYNQGLNASPKPGVPSVFKPKPIISVPSSQPILPQASQQPSLLSTTSQPSAVTKPPAPSTSSSIPNAGVGGGVGGGPGQKGSATFAGSSAPTRGRGVLNQQTPGARIPLCGSCNNQIRGPFITALGKIWCPDHFVCVNGQCRRPLQDIGFVEEKGELYCEYCFEQFIAPSCNKCSKKIMGDCVNAIGKHFHPDCFLCAYCGKLFGNSPFFLEDGLPYCEADWSELFTTKCFACGFPIEAGDRWVEALNNNYHSQCFNCTNCKKNLEGQSFYAKGGRPFCKAHAR